MDIVICIFVRENLQTKYQEMIEGVQFQRYGAPNSNSKRAALNDKFDNKIEYISKQVATLLFIPLRFLYILLHLFSKSVTVDPL